jgi:uncharacterized membrane protein YqhA
MWQTIIHCVFIISAVGIAYVDKLSQNSLNSPAKGFKDNGHHEAAH